jgi:hypothetical protein
MLNQVILLKVKQRLNKLASNDYDNVESWQIVEAFNKAQVDWSRRNLHGTNAQKEGDEQSVSRIDDLQILLHPMPLAMVQRPLWYESNPLPDDFMRWKRVSTQARSQCCPTPRPMVIYLTEEGNVDILLRDKDKQPSFEWGETFATVHDHKVIIYTNGEFDVVNPYLTYYRQPRKIQITSVVDPYTGTTPTTDVECEFKDDLIELIIDEAVKILSGDIESFNQATREGTAVETNN